MVNGRQGTPLAHFDAVSLLPTYAARCRIEFLMPREKTKLNVFFSFVLASGFNYTRLSIEISSRGGAWISIDIRTYVDKSLFFDKAMILIKGATYVRRMLISFL